MYGSRRDGALACAALATMLLTSTARATSGREVQERLTADLAAGKPVVVHVIVALSDNLHQGIVRVPESLGNGQQPGSNLYWGALYGVRSYLPRAGWTRLACDRPSDAHILDRAVFSSQLERNGAAVPVFIVADAWDGAYIRPALQRFLATAAGLHPELVRVSQGSGRIELQAGAQAHLVAYIGHDGLMDFSLSRPTAPDSTLARSALVLACASRSYFLDHLEAARCHPLLLTTGLMAPEAYTLDAVVRSWVAGASGSRVMQAAAQAYSRYQRCDLRAARSLFWGAP